MSHAVKFLGRDCDVNKKVSNDHFPVGVKVCGRKRAGRMAATPKAKSSSILTDSDHERLAGKRTKRKDNRRSLKAQKKISPHVVMLSKLDTTKQSNLAKKAKTNIAPHGSDDG